MQQQERELITGLFGRLQPFEAQPRDAEAEALIRESVARQPAAPYLLVQAVLVQEQALKAAQERIAELEARVATPAAPPSAGFLGSAPRLGPWGSAAASPPRPSVPSSRSPLQAALAPQGPSAGPAAAPAAGGGFLRSALATAAGVAGGALLFEGIRNMMGSSPGAFGPSLAQTPSPLLPPDGLSASSLPASVPDPVGQQQAAWDDPNAYGQDTADPDDDYDTATLDQDGGGDFGGGDDDSWA